MIKGISRQIIEVVDTGSDFYERALLILKPEYIDEERALLELEARRALKDMGVPSIMHKGSKVMYWLIRLGIAAAAGAGVTAIAMIM